MESSSVQREIAPVVTEIPRFNGTAPAPEGFNDAVHSDIRTHTAHENSDGVPDIGAAGLRGSLP